MKRVIWSTAVALALIVVIGGVFAVRSGMFATPDAIAATEDPALQNVVVTNNLITSDARVVPVRKADLTFAGGGIVKEVLVTEGQQVAAGDLLARLDAAQQQVAVAQAQANLKRAEAQLAQLKADKIGTQTQLRDRVAGKLQRNEHGRNDVGRNQHQVLGHLRVGDPFHAAEHGVQEHDGLTDVNARVGRNAEETREGDAQPQPEPAESPAYQCHGVPVRASGPVDGAENPSNAQLDDLLTRLPANR